MTTENIAGLAASASRQALPYLKSSIKHFVFVPALISLLAAGGVESAKAAQADLALITNTSPDPVIVNSNGVDRFTCTYSFTVSNAGPATATGVVISNQLPFWVGTFISATGGSTPTNGSLLINLGSLAVAATSAVQIVVQCNADTVDTNGVMYRSFTNVFQVYADQPDPDPANNTATTVFGIARTTTYSTSTRTIETNLTSEVNLQATNYTTELIAMMPSGTVLFDQSFNTVFSDPSVQAAVTQAAGDLTAAGATSYTGPTETSFLQSLVGSSTVTVTNVVGTNVSVATSSYVGPQTIMVGPDQSMPLFVLAGQMDFDTLVTAVVTNLVTTTNTDTYLDSAVYTMTAIVPQADLSLSASALPAVYVYPESNLVYSIIVSNAGPAIATGVVVSNRLPYGVNFVSATGDSTPTNGVLLVNLGALAVGATDLVQIVEQPTTNNETMPPYYSYWSVTNVFQVSAAQSDPDPTNNSATVISQVSDATTLYTQSTLIIETNFTLSVSQQATNYSTELIAVMPGGTVLFDQTFDAGFSNAAMQAAVTQAAADLNGAGATSYTGPTQTSFLQSLVGNSSVTTTNVIGISSSVTATTYIGPQTIMVGPNQSEALFVVGGQIDVDTLVTAVVTNLVTTTNTDTYLDSAVYTMTAIVPQPELGLAAVRSNQFGFTITGTSNLSIVVEACTNLATPSWTTLELFRFTNGPIYFSDPAWRSYPMRFYRTRLP